MVWVLSSARHVTKCKLILRPTDFTRRISNDKFNHKPPWRILFFGTNEFSLESLKAVHDEMKSGNLIRQLEVVTKKQAHVVKKYALKHQIKTHEWPVSIVPGEFDIGLVVAFGHLIPKHIIDAFPLGMLNVHGSLLPRWRGAAPIIHAIMNGDEETGITIMKIMPHKFDVGQLVKRKKSSILPNEFASPLTNRLARIGSELLVECIKELPMCLHSCTNQPATGITNAPRITSKMSAVDWAVMSAQNVYNLHRALSEIYPLTTEWFRTTVKLHEAIFPLCGNTELLSTSDSRKSGYVKYISNIDALGVLCKEGWIGFRKVGVKGKRTMTAKDFYNGYMSKVKDDERYFGNSVT